MSKMAAARLASARPAEPSALRPSPGATDPLAAGGCLYHM